ncbi:MAG: sensor histidine kinase [Alphaproteobacteria bacterium]
MSEPLDPEGWTHRLPEWQREVPAQTKGWRNRVGAALRNDRITLYVVTLTLLWLGLLAFRTSMVVMNGYSPLDHMGYRALLTVCGYAMTLAFGLAVYRIERVSLGAALAVTAMLVFIGAALFTYISFEIFNFLNPENSEKIRFWFRYYSNVYIFLIWSFLYFVVRYVVSLQHQRQATLRAVALAHEAKLEVLRYQLNPHFLFNTLNAISTLVLQKKTELAEETIDRLSTFLRHTLASDPKEQVTLAQELEAIDLYLQIQKVRFGKRMTYDFRITPEAREGCVPGLILQPVVENAVKYAVAPQQEGAHVEISATKEGPRLVIEVCDTGPGVADPDAVTIQGTGVGLANCRGRLREFYGVDAELTLINRKPHGLCVRIVIPYREGPRNA